jgi:predicted nucleic acid-binding Zn ribbon protein
MALQNINKTLNENIKKYAIDDRVKHYQVVQVWEKIVTSFLPEAAAKTMAVSFERGVLVVASLSSQVAEKIRMFHDQMVKALNEFIGGVVVQRIQCEC